MRAFIRAFAGAITCFILERHDWRSEMLRYDIFYWNGMEDETHAEYEVFCSRCRKQKMVVPIRMYRGSL